MVLSSFFNLLLDCFKLLLLMFYFMFLFKLKTFGIWANKYMPIYNQWHQQKWTCALVPSLKNQVPVPFKTWKKNLQDTIELRGNSI